jgi:hypothetical protein
MKKAIVSLFVFSTLTLLTFAQHRAANNESKVTLGLFAGLNIPQLSGGNNNEMSRDYTSRLGAAFGLTTSYSLGSALALRADVLYSSEGGKRNGLQAIEASSFNPEAPAGSYLYADFNNESILNYIEIPVLLKYSFLKNKPSNFYVDFGPYIGFLLNATQKTSGSSIVYADATGTQPITVDPESGQPYAVPFGATTDIKSDINAFNFGLTGGIGFEQKAGKGQLFLDLRGAYGLTTVQKDSKNGESHNGYLLISLGYTISL